MKCSETIWGARFNFLQPDSDLNSQLLLPIMQCDANSVCLTPLLELIMRPRQSLEHWCMTSSCQLEWVEACLTAAAPAFQELETPKNRISELWTRQVKAIINMTSYDWVWKYGHLKAWFEELSKERDLATITPQWSSHLHQGNVCLTPEPWLPGRLKSCDSFDVSDWIRPLTVAIRSVSNFSTAQWRWAQEYLLAAHINDVLFIKSSESVSTSGLSKNTTCSFSAASDNGVTSLSSLASASISRVPSNSFTTASCPISADSDKAVCYHFHL